MWLNASNIKCVHGFSTRHGGVSSTPFDTLNLGGSDDAPQNIFTNRQLALKTLNLLSDNLCTLKQVHGVTVCGAQPGQQEGDALVTANKELILAVSIADCYPLLFHDPVNDVVGAAHAGWRGTMGKIAANVVGAMKDLGAQSEHIQVAIGQGICCDRFEVGPEVTEQFTKAGFPSYCIRENKIDLVACNRFVLEESGILAKHIWAMNRCTFEEDFFSYRRDKGQTGRMWGLITLGN